MAKKQQIKHQVWAVFKNPSTNDFVINVLASTYGIAFCINNPAQQIPNISDIPNAISMYSIILVLVFFFFFKPRITNVQN